MAGRSAVEPPVAGGRSAVEPPVAGGSAAHSQRLDPGVAAIEPATAASLLADFGFLASPDLPDRPGPAYLLVALRPTPTLRHYDPECVEYWVTEGDRGARRELRRSTRVPLVSEFSWGLIRITDRLHVTNEYLGFGGTLRAAAVGDAVIAAFTSPVPLLRRGGHSQAIDPGADAVGAWFGRFLLAVDYVPGFEAAASHASPVARYAAFLGDAVDRLRRTSVQTSQADLAALLGREARQIRAQDPAAWSAGADLRAALAS
jgi:hypothetical protein